MYLDLVPPSFQAIDMSRYAADRIDFATRATRLAASLLTIVLAWEAWDPTLGPSKWSVLLAYFLLGGITTAAFPRRVGMGVIAALGVVILLEVLQSVVPERDVTWLELVAKWLCALCGSVMMLIMSLVNGTRRR
jgi:hypothetical protein